MDVHHRVGRLEYQCHDVEGQGEWAGLPPFVSNDINKRLGAWSSVLSGPTAAEIVPGGILGVPNLVP